MIDIVIFFVIKLNNCEENNLKIYYMCQKWLMKLVGFRHIILSKWFSFLHKGDELSKYEPNVNQTNVGSGWKLPHDTGKTTFEMNLI